MNRLAAIKIIGHFSAGIRAPAAPKHVRRVHSQSGVTRLTQQAVGRRLSTLKREQSPPISLKIY